MTDLPIHLALLPQLLLDEGQGHSNNPARLVQLLDGDHLTGCTNAAVTLHGMIDRQYPPDFGSPLVESLNRLLHRLVQLHVTSRAARNLPGIAQRAIRLDLRDTELSIRARIDTLEQTLLD